MIHPPRSTGLVTKALLPLSFGSTRFPIRLALWHTRRAIGGVRGLINFNEITETVWGSGKAVPSQSVLLGGHDVCLKVNQCGRRTRPTTRPLPKIMHHEIVVLEQTRESE